VTRAGLPFLRRSLKGAGGAGADVLARGGLAMKVCVRTYRLFFVPGSEDVLVREPGADETAAAARGARIAAERRAQWITEADQGRGALFEKGEKEGLAE
jgi:paired amphipathic helix protein Sin3a